MMQGPQQPHSPASPNVLPPASERLMALLAHLSILLPHFGVVAPFILWLANRGTAPFAAYQAKQALFFHLGVIAATWIVIILGIMLSIVTLGLGLLALIPLLGLLHLGPIVYGIVAAIQAHAGHPFRYWLIGKWVQPD